MLTLLKKAVDDWYNEYTSYDYNHPGFSEATGHFTCLVWKSSTRFGLGISINNVTTVVDVTMNTSPPGNYAGEFATNVLPSVSITIPLPPSPVPNPVPVPVPNPVPVPVPNPVPVPVPNPVPVPVPNPVPNPVPVPTPPPTPTPLPNLYDLITAVYNIIYAIQMRQPKPLIINALYKTINTLTTYRQLDSPTQRQIYLLLSKATMAIQQQSSKQYILLNLQQVLNTLNQHLGK
jgi:hypothetical protein